MAYKSSKKSWFQQVKEIEKCNLLRARIKTYVAQQGVTQKSFAEKIKVTEKQLQRFMSGTSLTGSEVYTRSMAFLKTKLPAAAVSVDILENPEGVYSVMLENATKTYRTDICKLCMDLEKAGAGELCINSINREGSMKGYDTKLTKLI